MRIVLLTLALTLASVVVPVASAQGGCDPRDGPFSPCYWQCEPGWEPECELLLGAGQRVWNYYCDRISPTC